MAEIKEIKEKNQKDDDLLLSIAAGSRHHIVPNLEFEFTDKDIHEDLLKLIKFSCEEICTTKEQLNKVLRLWTTFLEPMLGAPSSLQNPNSAEDSETSSHGVAKTAGTSAPEINGSPDADGSKPACIGAQATLPDQVDSSKNSLLNGDGLTKEDSSKPERDSAPALGVATVNKITGDLAGLYSCHL